MKKRTNTRKNSTGIPRTIAVGIPAHNEEKNIAKLLRAALVQRAPDNMCIAEIIVVSDGSTDGTVKAVRAIADPRIQLIVHPERRGLSVTLNEISSRAMADVLILLDADIFPKNDDLFVELVELLIADERAGVVGAAVEPFPSRGVFESIIAHGHRMKTDIYERIRDGDTIYLCHGRARALRKELYRSLQRPESCPEDSYSYLACHDAGYHFVYAPRARVLFYPPKNLRDHALQSRRFISGRQLLKSVFPLTEVEAVFRIPLRMGVSRIAQHFLRSPVRTTAYLLLLGWMMVTTPFVPINHVQWPVSKTSKS